MIRKLLDTVTSLLQNQSIPAEALEKYPQLKDYNLLRDRNKRGAFCHAPATNMYFSQTGEVKVCCHNMEFTAGKYPEQTLEEIWNSPEAKSMRESMRNYKLEADCEICTSDLRTNSFEEVRARHFDNIPSHEAYPTQMEFLLTNTCNLECVMCKGEFSSSIRQNREGLAPIKNVYDDAFIEQLKPFIPYLHETRFSGSGEAFLIEQNYKIWELIISINPACKIMIQSNGTVLNSRIKSLLERGNFQLGVSLDSLQKDVFEAIRPNAKFERVMETITYFSNYSRERKRKFNISTCVMRQNRMELPQFLEFSNSIGAVQNFHKVWHPREHAVFNLPTAELEAMYNHLAQHQPAMDTALHRLNGQHYRYFVSVVEQWWQDALLGKSQVREEVHIGESINAINDHALQDYLFKSIRQYLMEQSMLFPHKAIMDFELIETKINVLLSRMPNDKFRYQAIRQMLSSKLEQVIVAINTQEIDTLLKLAEEAHRE